MSKILDYLFLGNIDDSTNYEFLHDNNIKTIINLTTFQNKIIYQDIKYYNLMMLDSPDQPLIFIINCVNNIIDKNKKYGNILIHCYVGKSRSASCVIGYLLHLHNYKYNVNLTLKHIQSIRPIVKPNNGFIE
jgi:protein-tyrosine phosphatase